MFCANCGRTLRTTCDRNLPYVHADSGNAFCDVTDPRSAVESRWANPLGLRDTAIPVKDL